VIGMFTVETLKLHLKINKLKQRLNLKSVPSLLGPGEKEKNKKKERIIKSLHVQTKEILFWHNT